jgi:RNA polymerase sigma factor (TIGR02999 family)
MRSVIVDLARERMAERRGGGATHVTLTTGLGERLSNERPEVVLVHDALQELAAIEPRLAQVVEMRYYGGLEHAEIASALGVSLRTVERDWERARSYLYAVLSTR